MKVLIVHNYYRNHGGEETSVSNKIKLLKENGIEVKTFSRNNSNIKNIYHKILIFFSSIFSFRSAKAFKKTITDFKPDIIEVHNTFPMISPSIFSTAKKLNIPLIYYLHNFRNICGSSIISSKNKCCEKCNGNFFLAIKNQCYRKSYLGSLSLATNNFIHKNILKTWKKQVDTFVIMNKNNLNYFTEFGINSNKIHLLPHFTFMNSSRMLKKKNYALFVGEFSRNKGFHTLIKAFNEIDYQLKIIGQVKNKDEDLKKLNINLNKVGFINKKRNIENIGFVENNQLSKYYAEANFTIFPSEAEETFGYVIIESFANFTPVLSSNQKSLKKIVKNEYNGLLFESGDHLDLKNKIEWLVRNTSFTKNMSFNAKKDFDNNYSSKIHFSALMSLYKKAISLQTK